MAKQDETAEDLDEATDEVIEAESITEEKVRHWIAEAIEAITNVDVDGDEEEGEHAEPSKMVTLRDVEEATRRAVEEAMKPLRAAKKPAPKKKPEAKVEPEPMPMEAKKKTWAEKMWGA